MAPIEVQIEFKDEDIPGKHYLEFDDFQLAVFRKYSQNFSRLEQTNLWSSGFHIGLQVAWNEKNGLSVSTNPVSSTDVCEYLHVARPIFLQNEPASFKNTLAALNKAGCQTSLGKALKPLRNYYDKGDPNMLQIWFNDQPLIHKSAVDLWLNGIEYHQDKEKSQKIEELEEFWTRDHLQTFFFIYLGGQTHASFVLATYIRQILNIAEEK